MEQKLKFITDWETGVYTLTELSQMHNISLDVAQTDKFIAQPAIDVKAA